MISQTAEYALRAVVRLAAESGHLLSTHDISKATKVPGGYLSKVLQTLARAGLISSAPGRSGGFRLLRPPDKISVLDVISAVDGIQRIRRCPLDLKSHGANLCPLHRKLDDAMKLAEQAFASSPISDLIAEQTGSKPLCQERSPRLQIAGARK